MQPKLIIAIDGPAGSGKSSTAKAFAKHLKLPYIDTGAMYRAITLKAMQEKIPFEDTPALVAISKKAKIELKGSDPAKQRVLLDGKDVTRAIRTPELTKKVFYVAQEPLIRREMVKKQRAMGQKAGGVLEGRDIGTMVFPKADFKFYFEASLEVRARRRQRELAASGRKLSQKEVLKDIRRRDETDFKRKEGPLRRAKDAFLVDTSALTIPQTIDKMISLMHAKPLKGKKLSG